MSGEDVERGSIATDASLDDERVEENLRPRSLDEMIGVTRTA